VIQIVTVAEMKEADEAAHQRGLLEELVERAGWAVHRRAMEMLGGAYGRRVVVVAGRGNNGADGRVCARLLAARGAQVVVFDAKGAPEELPVCDLVVDAAYGTGFHGTYRAPSVASGTPVLAVDIPSGVDGDTGRACEGAVSAEATVTFAALKPGLLFGDGPAHAGDVRVADIGLEISPSRAVLLEDGDVVVPARGRFTHKWSNAVMVVAGSAGMAGAARLSALGALRAGAGMVRLAMREVAPCDLPDLEAVAVSLPEDGWAEEVASELERFRALAVGPGLGRDGATGTQVRELVSRAPVPCVVDADGLAAFGSPDELAEVVAAVPDRPVVLTPHDGEFARLAGKPPSDDRITSVRSLAAKSGCTVLLKGPVTVVASPDGQVACTAAGTPALATPGSGDVLTGVVAALLARGLGALESAAFGAHAHGAAAARYGSTGMIASELPAMVQRWLREVAGGGGVGG